MAVSLILETALRTTLADAITTAIDYSTSSPLGNGTLRFKTAASPMATVATINFSRPSFGAASAGVITMANAPKSDTNAAGGTMAFFTINRKDNTPLMTGNVATSAATINFPAGVVVTAGDTVQLTSFTITVPAGT